MPRSIAQLASGDMEAFTLGVIPLESGEEFLHYSEKSSPETEKFPAGQDAAPCHLEALPETNINIPCLQIKCSWRHTLKYVIYIL